jgi:hypothetical protein
MPQVERMETDEEKRRRLSAGCSLERVVDEVDHALIGV